MKYSIIIPTAFDKCESLLKPCCESIIQNTDLNQTEVIVVSNGSTDNTDEYVKSLGEPFKLISFPKPIGYSAAINAGVKESKGEFIIPLNNDTIIYGPKNAWIEILAAPFWDMSVGITGPWKNWCPFAEREFLIFFCVMIKKSMFNYIGYLDEASFGVGYGEDADFCFRLTDAGFGMIQVPEEKKLDYNGQYASGNFPIYHAGNQTFKDHPDEQLIWRNRDILKKKYCLNTGNAMKTDGFMAEQELLWLARETRKQSNNSIIIEIGSWKGRSSRAIADNLSKDTILYCVDTWAGSEAEKETNHQSAKWMNGDFAYFEFCKNLWNYIKIGKVIPLRMNSKNAAKFFKEQNIKSSFIFVDGGHQYNEVQEDIWNYLPLLTKDGIICGHDYKQGLMPEVTPAVNDIFGSNVGHAPGTTIWFTNSRPTKETQYNKSNIYDCFIFNNELDLLELRFKNLYDFVDRFIVVEASSTHQRQSKPLYFKDNLQKFAKYLHKVTHIVVDFPPELSPNAGNSQEAGEAYWAIERFQRNKIMDGLHECKPNDIIIISDLDEIPNLEALKSYKINDGIKSFEMDLYYYNENCKASGKWCEAKIAPFSKVKELSPCGIRYSQTEKILNGGKHLSYFGGVDAIIEKINNTAHREYNTDHYKNPERIQKCINNCIDIFERPNEKFEKV